MTVPAHSWPVENAHESLQTTLNKRSWIVHANGQERRTVVMLQGQERLGTFESDSGKRSRSRINDIITVRLNSKIKFDKWNNRFYLYFKIIFFNINLLKFSIINFICFIMQLSQNVSIRWEINFMIKILVRAREYRSTTNFPKIPL